MIVLLLILKTSINNRFFQNKKRLILLDHRKKSQFVHKRFEYPVLLLFIGPFAEPSETELVKHPLSFYQFPVFDMRDVLKDPEYIK